MANFEFIRSSLAQGEMTLVEVLVAILVVNLVSLTENIRTTFLILPRDYLLRHTRKQIRIIIETIRFYMLY